MEYNDIIDKAYALVDSIKQSDEFLLLKEMKAEINFSLSDLILKFDKAKEKYAEALQYGKHHPNLEEYKKELSEIKAELFTNELVTKYKKIESMFQSKLDVIINEVKKAMSNKFEQTKKIEL